ncbi:MAG: hypothetical protein H0T54_04075 [Geodermatophilaceae bacterium]|nr:hypothetical protein [Geodermatophilaceae bacterium]
MQNPRGGARSDLFDEIEKLEGKAARDLLDGDYWPPPGDRSPEATCRIERTVPTSAKVIAYNLLNAGTRVTERKLFALVDAASCVLDHGQRYGGQETTRLALEAVAPQAIALAALRALEGHPAGSGLD